MYFTGHQSQDNVTQNCLVESWEKVIVKFIIKCEDATEHIVTEWMSCDTEANLDKKKNTLVRHKPQDDSDLDEADE